LYSPAVPTALIPYQTVTSAAQLGILIKEAGSSLIPTYFLPFHSFQSTYKKMLRAHHTLHWKIKKYEDYRLPWLTLFELFITHGLLPKVLLYALSVYILLKRMKSNKLPGATYSRFQNTKQKRKN